MNLTTHEFEKRLAFLERLQKEKEAALSKAPKGRLRIDHRDQTIRFYHCERSGENGRYLVKSEYAFARQLAQKMYDKRVLLAAEKEAAAIRRYLNGIPENPAESLYQKLPAARQALVSPISESDEQYLERWNAHQYEGLAYAEDAPPFFTDRNERVRSKSEIIIANALDREGLPYHYEQPLYLEGYGNVYPDFTILQIERRREIIWEHFGMMDVPEYAEKTIRKIALYQQNGYYLGDNLIASFETSGCPLDSRMLQMLIRKYLLPSV